MFVDDRELIRKDMKNTVSESVKVLVAVSDTFKHFDFVVAALGKTVSYSGGKGIENAGHPVQHSLSAFLKSYNSGIIRGINPIGKCGFSGSPVLAIKDFQKILFVKMSNAEYRRNIQHIADKCCDFIAFGLVEFQKILC